MYKISTLCLISSTILLNNFKTFLFLFYLGATKEIGTALTRMCLRHRAVEARMKTFSR